MTDNRDKPQNVSRRQHKEDEKRAIALLGTNLHTAQSKALSMLSFLLAFDLIPPQYVSRAQKIIALAKTPTEHSASRADVWKPT